MPGIEGGREGDEYRVDGREGEQHDGDHQQHVVQPAGARIGQTGGPWNPAGAQLGMSGSTAMIPLTVMATLATARIDAAGPPRSDPQADQQRDGNRADMRSAARCAGAAGPSRRAPGPCWFAPRGWQERTSRLPPRRGRRVTTSPTVVRGRGAPLRRRRSGRRSGLVSSGDASQPTASPPAAASSPRTTYSASSTEAIRRGVAPTALSSPTRRIWSAMRPPTSTAMLASASMLSSQLPVSSALCSFLIRLPSCLADVLPGLEARCAQARAAVGAREHGGRRWVRQLQVQDVGDLLSSVARAFARPRASSRSGLDEHRRNEQRRVRGSRLFTPHGVMQNDDG